MNRPARTTAPRTATALVLSAFAAALALGSTVLPADRADDTSGRHVVADSAAGYHKTDDPLEWNSKE
ncbi:hypothetical protein [Streptomyces sp. NPDC058401]|uniref:hypothetical protein n=1 Tax=Streptomyces sp. NPDC058401 TaxID=3346480 RepID=UPI00365E0014